MRDKPNPAEQLGSLGSLRQLGQHALKQLVQLGLQLLARLRNADKHKRRAVEEGQRRNGVLQLGQQRARKG